MSISTMRSSPTSLTIGLMLIASLFPSLLRSAQAAELRRGPYLQDQRPESIRIRWRTDPSVRFASVVRYGTSPDHLNHAVAATEVHQHFTGSQDWEAVLENLSPDTTYYYALEADRATLCGADEHHQFRTSPTVGSDRTLRFWILGDSGSNRPRELTVEAALEAGGPMDPVLVRNGFRSFNRGSSLDGIILLGDNAYPFGTDEQYQAALFNLYDDELRKTPLWPCVGNHDMDGAFPYLFTTPAGTRTWWTASGCLTYYSVDIGNLHLVVLDPWSDWLFETSAPDHAPWQEQLQWLEEDLAATAQEWIMVVNHFPVYCDGNYQSDSNGPLVTLREQLVPILDRYGVDLFLAGHDHTYQRSYLIRGHLGRNETYDSTTHRISESDGRDSPIIKEKGPNSGTVYIVSGTGGGTRPQGAFQQSAFVPFPTDQGERRGFAKPSSLVIEVEGRSLRGWQVDIQGRPLDTFTIVHPDPND